MISLYLMLTLEYLINVQEVINMQAGKISKINKRAGGNKAVQVGKFQKINNLCSTFIRYSRVHTPRNSKK